MCFFHSLETLVGWELTMQYKVIASQSQWIAFYYISSCSWTIGQTLFPATVKVAYLHTLYWHMGTAVLRREHPGNNGNLSIQGYIFIVQMEIILLQESGSSRFSSKFHSLTSHWYLNKFAAPYMNSLPLNRTYDQDLWHWVMYWFWRKHCHHKWRHNFRFCIYIYAYTLYIHPYISIYT